MADHTIEKIKGDNHRPGMPESGWLVRYSLSEHFGWMRMKTFSSQVEAEEFAKSLVPESAK